MNSTIKILVIDDEEVIHASIKRILSRFGYEVVGALSAAEGLKSLSSEKFDAVITDLMMPQMNGLEMLSAMKDQGIAVPSIMITGYPTIKTAIQALRLGALDYLPKPFTRLELLSPLQRTLRRAGALGSPLQQDIASGEEVADRQPPRPGDRFHLPGHSWALYNQDGTVDIGLEAGFLGAMPPVDRLVLPQTDEMIEQGHAGIEATAGDEVHAAFMPVSGRVIEVRALADMMPPGLSEGDWLIRILPSNLAEETAILRKAAG